MKSITWPSHRIEYPPIRLLQDTEPLQCSQNAILACRVSLTKLVQSVVIELLAVELCSFLLNRIVALELY